jgi:hypothetical protein
LSFRLEKEIPPDIGSSAEQPTFNNYPYKDSVEYEVRKRVSKFADAPLDWERVCSVAELQSAPMQRKRLGIRDRDVIVWYHKDGGGPGIVRTY